MFWKEKESQTEEKILDYVYEIVEEDVNTYMLWQKDDIIYRVFRDHYYWSVLGEKTIDKLRGRGYLSLEEAYQKYGVLEIPIWQNEKKEGFVKTFFRKGERN